MKQVKKVFLHNTGIIIITNQEPIILEMGGNTRFKELPRPKSQFKVFISEDIWGEVSKKGLPKSVRQYIINLVFS